MDLLLWLSSSSHKFPLAIGLLHSFSKDCVTCLNKVCIFRLEDLLGFFICCGARSCYVIVIWIFHYGWVFLHIIFSSALWLLQLRFIAICRYYIQIYGGWYLFLDGPIRIPSKMCRFNINYLMCRDGDSFECNNLLRKPSCLNFAHGFRSEELDMLNLRCWF